jgi:hypothetical protein
VRNPRESCGFAENFRRRMFSQVFLRLDLYNRIVLSSIEVGEAGCIFRALPEKYTPLPRMNETLYNIIYAIIEAYKR